MRFYTNLKIFLHFFKDNLRVPRSITLLEKENLLCIGDDGNRRIICYPIEDDSKNDVEDLVIVITDFRLGRIFAIDHIGNF